MTACIYNTDREWIDFLKNNSLKNGVNFWRKDKRDFHLPAGSDFYFKVRGTQTIAGKAMFVRQESMPIGEAWKRFGLGNGVESEAELKKRADQILGLSEGADLNCLILDSVELLDEADFIQLIEGEFPPSIMASKFYDNHGIARIHDAFASEARDPTAELDNGIRKSRRDTELWQLTQEMILNGISRYENGEDLGFRDSTKFDVFHSDKRYPPKAICGLATIGVIEPPLGPEAFSGGIDSVCFKVLSREGFHIGPKEGEYEPIESEEELEKQVDELRKIKSLSKPTGSKTPKKTQTTSEQFARSPQVVAYVLNRANGICECCGNPAPFKKNNGDPFLEVHHIQPLADGGEDTISNAAAICPNCHRECHYGINKVELSKNILSKISEL